MKALLVLTAVVLAGGCSAQTGEETTPQATSSTTGAPADSQTSEPDPPFSVQEIAEFDEPWAMTFLPGTDYLAITERGGRMLVREMTSGRTMDVENLPEVAVGGQGGLGDVIAAPDFADSGTIFLSWAQEGEGGTGAVVALCRLEIDDDGARLTYNTTIWTQEPKTSGSGHFGHRLALSPDGDHLFITSGDRQKMDPAQDLGNTLGTVVRLRADGSTPPDNPFADRGSPNDQIWSYGHRNPLGLAFDAEGTLWESEMGPRGGDEVNVILPGKNYGWPLASDGSHYDGAEIPDHSSQDEFEDPKVSWNPSVSPGSLMIYTGDAFPQWRGDAFIGALSGESLIRLDLDGTSASPADQWSDGELGARLREVEQAPDGTIYVLQDGGGGKLLHLTPTG